MPGIIGALIIDVLTTYRKREAYQFIIHAFLLGLSSYGILSLIVFLNNKILEYKKQIPTWKVTFFDSLFSTEARISLIEVFFSSLIAIVIAILLVKIINKKLIYTWANKLKISNKHGEDDVWEYLLGSDEVEWISIRDLDHNLVYQGMLRAFSDKDDKRELYLTDVIVYDNQDGDELYKMDHMYFYFDVNSNIVIELHKSKESENHEQQSETN